MSEERSFEDMVKKVTNEMKLIIEEAEKDGVDPSLIKQYAYSTYTRFCDLASLAYDEELKRKYE